jgi:hypothetical protein
LRTRLAHGAPYSMAKSAVWTRTAAATSTRCSSGVNGKDLTTVPLLERKRVLVSVLPKIDTRLLYLDHIAQRGVDLYRAACERDLEGIVAKWAHGTYQAGGRQTSWLKIKNLDYTQVRDRHELFEGRSHDSDVRRAKAVRPELAFL